MKNQWKSIVYFLIIVAILLIFYYLGKHLTTNQEEGFQLIPAQEVVSNEIVSAPEVNFPFKNFRDDKGQILNIVLISAPFRTEEDEKKYIEYSEMGLKFCGISSYLEFPDKITNPFEDRFHEQRNHDYLKMVSTWVHCFRDPSPALKNSGIPLLMMSEADLKDTQGYYKPDPTIKKEYDFMYICLNDDETGQKCEPGWQWYNRNWDLAKKCLVVMCRKFKLKGVIVGRENCPFTEHCSGIVKTLPFLPFNEFQKEMQKCKFLFVPNVSDASPRVITEAMCYNMPVLVNYNIIGGWHNVVPGVTGEFFTDEFDVVPALKKITENYDDYQTRDWYCENRGQEVAGGQMLKFLRDHYPNINCPDAKFVTI